jgi:lysophospholipase L1-like esterase
MHRLIHRLIAGIASVALLLVLVVPATARPATPTLYLALGDSLAWGDGASVPAHTGYVPRLAGYFQGAPHGGAAALQNLGLGGGTTPAETTTLFLANQLGPALDLITDDTTDTRVVTISLGGDDLLDLINEPSDPCVIDILSSTCQGLIAGALTTVGANMAQILGALHAALAADPGDEKVFVLTLYNPFGGPGNPFAAYELPVDLALQGSDLTVDCVANRSDPTKIGLNDVLVCTALFFGDIPVQTYALFDDNGLTLTHIGEGFNIHPNDEGYALIAKAHREADRAS